MDGNKIGSYATWRMGVVGGLISLGPGRAVAAEVVELSARRRIAANALVSSLSGEIQVPRPDALQPFHLASATERRRRVRRVLLGGWALWCFGDRKLVDAVREAANGAESEYALIELRRVLLELDLHAWESHPARLRADVHSLFRRAVGGLTPHRGGWRVSR